MADKKISELTNITGANLADGDELVVVDTSASETKAITFGEFKTALDTSTGFVRITGDTMTGDLDVQGTVTADGLTVNSGAVDNTALFISSDASAFITFSDVNTTTFPQVGGQGNNLLLRTNNKKSVLIESNNDISFYEDTGTTAKMVWSASAERLGITDSTVGAAFSDADGVRGSTNGLNTQLQLYKAGGSDGGISLAAGSSGSAAVGLYANKSGTNQADFVIRQDTGTGTSKETFRITDSGNVGIGETSPLTGLYGTVGHISGTSGGLILSSAVSTFGIGSVAGVLQFYDSTNATERMRIDSSGNLLVGKTSATGFGSTAGFEVLSDGRILSTVSGDQPLALSRTTSDGNIAEFYKDGSTVGSIGNDGTLLRVSSASTGGVFLADNGTNVFGFANGENALRPASDNTINLGKTDRRFKDLYLSGGVYLGGTGSANKLDDYEEGEYQVAVTASTSGSYTMRAGYTYYRYVKVGQMVHIQGMVSLSSASSPVGQPQINLPFTVGGGTNFSEWATGSALWWDNSGSAYTPKPIILTSGSTATVQMDAADLAAFDYIIVGFSYYTA